MLTASFWRFRMTLGRLKRRQDAEGTRATTPPILGCSARGLMLREKYEICVCSLGVCVCVAQSTFSARFPLCQSVAAMEDPGLAQPSISRLPWLSASTHIHRHTHTHTHSWAHTNLWQPSVQRKPRPPTTLLKGYSCCVRGHGAKKTFFLPRFNTDNRSCCSVIFSVFLVVMLFQWQPGEHKSWVSQVHWT